ncbi:DUF917 domain-containing protein [Kribbella sancticallisti]|uniref:DUF917 domain-containing protein n=1 Tax=Kribbella sancticallisti TaxID=460087 RepID=A0ABN2C825_9ACTN
MTLSDVPNLSLGCAVLGSGGGGQVSGAAELLSQTLELGAVEVVALDALRPGARTALVGAVGSPTVMLERLPGNQEFVTAVRAWERHAGVRLDAVCPLEIGGVNGILGVNVAAHLGLPVVDADGMGRAFPRLDMTVLAGQVPAAPAALAESRGATVVLDGLSDTDVEGAVRRLLPSLGTWSAICLYGGEVSASRGLVRGSISRALELGRILKKTRSTNAAGLLGLHTAPQFAGTVIELLRARSGQGVATMEGHVDPGQTLRIDFREEYVLATLDGEQVACVPDIITLLDVRTRLPVLAEELRTGQRLELLVLAGPVTGDGGPAPAGLADYGLHPGIGSVA